MTDSPTPAEQKREDRATAVGSMVGAAAGAAVQGATNQMGMPKAWAAIGNAGSMVIICGLLLWTQKTNQDNYRSDRDYDRQEARRIADEHTADRHRFYEALSGTARASDARLSAVEQKIDRLLDKDRRPGGVP